MVDGGSHRFDADEQEAFERDGYVIRRDVFGRSEVADLVAHCESLVADLVRDRVGHRMAVGSYVFDPDLLRGVMIKWEGESDAVHGIEPFAHLSEPLGRLGLDPRLVDPMRSVLGRDDVALFTEKLNLKRPERGGPNPLHQDYPYWREPAEDAGEVATTIVYLDDADVDNGCTWVAPGSHRSGMWRTRDDLGDFGANEIDPDAYPDVELVPVEVEAGSTVTFGAFLVHRSTPNRSTRDRRALLYSYQPAGRPTILDALRRMAAERAPSPSTRPPGFGALGSRSARRSRGGNGGGSTLRVRAPGVTSTASTRLNNGSTGTCEFHEV